MPPENSLNKYGYYYFKMRKISILERKIVLTIQSMSWLKHEQLFYSIY